MKITCQNSELCLNFVFITSFSLFKGLQPSAASFVPAACLRYHATSPNCYLSFLQGMDIPECSCEARRWILTRTPFLELPQLWHPCNVYFWVRIHTFLLQVDVRISKMMSSIQFLVPGDSQRRGLTPVFRPEMCFWCTHSCVFLRGAQFPGCNLVWSSRGHCWQEKWPVFFNLMEEKRYLLMEDWVPLIFHLKACSWMTCG